MDFSPTKALLRWPKAVIGNQHCGVRATSAFVDLVGSYYEEKLPSSYMRVCENTLGGPVNELIVFLLSKNYVIVVG